MYTKLLDFFSTQIPSPPLQVPLEEAQAAGLCLSSVAVCLFGSSFEQLQLLFIRRSAGKHHSQEIAFPGGRQDPGETLFETAVRECHEEIGLKILENQFVGVLSDVATGTGYLIRPHVFYLPEVIPSNLSLATGEVEALFSLSFEQLTQEGAWKVRALSAQGLLSRPWGAFVSQHSQRFLSADRSQFLMLDFPTAEGRLWGATALMTRELLAYLNLLPSPFPVSPIAFKT